MTTKLGEVARTRHINDVVGSYGFKLIGKGRVVQTFCPRPHTNGKDTNASLTLYADSQRFYCFGCRWWGDALDFIQEMERLSLQAAADKMGGLTAKPLQQRPAPAKRHRNPRRDGVLVAAALEFYGTCLFKQAQGQEGRSYLVRRNIDKATAKLLQLGYAGGGLAAHLTSLGFPVKRQMKSGLFLKYPRERFHRMVVVPEIRDGRAIWLTGRAVDADASPRFQSMPGGKPILGIGTAAQAQTLVVTEGVFDYLTLRRWGINAVGLAGNGNVDRIIAELKRVRPANVVFALDADDKTAEMQQELTEKLDCLVAAVRLPDGAGDVADLGMLADGRERFEIAILNAEKVEVQLEGSDSSHCDCGNPDCGGFSRKGWSADNDGRADHRVEAVHRTR